MPGLMKPKSRGTVRLASADPTAPLIVDPPISPSRPTSTPMCRASSSASRIGNGKGFDGVRKEQVSIPGARRAQIIEYVRANAATYFHFVGTCAMGSAASAPVDESAARARRGAAARCRRLGHAGDHLLQHPCADAFARRARGGDHPGGWSDRGGTAQRPVQAGRPCASGGGRYIAAHDEDRRHRHAPPPPFHDRRAPDLLSCRRIWVRGTFSPKCSAVFALIRWS